MASLFGMLLARLSGSRSISSTSRFKKARPGNRKPAARLALESLEDRWVPSNTGSIGGHVYLDTTGNGLQTYDPAQSGVTVKLFVDSNQNGVLDSGDAQAAAPQISAADGSFSFTNLAPGKYFVSEAVPAGFVRTFPTAGFYSTVNLADGTAVGGQNFTNFQKLNTSLITNISFTVTTPSGVQTVVTNLRGHTQQGDTVTANFSVAASAANAVVSLIAYDAPGASFDASTASQQVPIQIATGTFSPGAHSLTVQLPNNFYQVDFVAGAAIDQLGPAGSNIFYSAENRLLSADNNGKQTAAPTLSGTIFDANMLPPASGSAVMLLLTGYNANGTQVSQATAMVDSVTGFYSFTGLQAGVTYTLTVSDTSKTYATQTIPGIQVTNGTSIDDFDLVLQLNMNGGGGVSTGVIG